MDKSIYSSENYKTFYLKDYLYWGGDFEEVRRKILQSRDPKRENYSPKRFRIEDQEEMTVLYYKDKLVAFSSLFNGGHFKYPDLCYRVLNRSWKSPKIRWVKEPYWIISQKMLLPQIEKARNIGANAIFISTEAKRHKWIQRWVRGAQNDEKRWTINNGMTQVCNGIYSKCWQNVAYLPLNDNPNWRFPLPTVSIEDWNNRVKYE